MSDRPTILFAGGGTGGHIYPNVAIWQRLHERGARFDAVFVVSQREVDQRVLEGLTWPDAQGNPQPMLERDDVSMLAVPASPLSSRPWHWLKMYRNWRASVRLVAELLTGRNVVAAVVTGGFVSAPVAAATSRVSLPTALVNLDAVPGKANRLIAGWTNQLFSVYPQPTWEHMTQIAPVVRREAIGPADVKQARLDLGLDPGRFTLFVSGGSQGAGTINQAMQAITEDPEVKPAFERWQVLHLAGSENDAMKLTDAYRHAGVAATAIPYCTQMGAAWRAADLAIARGGAGSVAEAWANRTRTIVMPYPYHRDRHQRLNVQLLPGGDELFTLIDDQADLEANLEQLAELPRMMKEIEEAGGLDRPIADDASADGAGQVAAWLAANPAMCAENGSSALTPANQPSQG